jgi:WD40 repeat protein
MAGFNLLPFTNQLRDTLADSHVLATLPSMSEKGLAQISWRPDGTDVALVDGQGRILLWPATPGAAPTPIPGIEKAMSAEWRPDGKELAIVTETGLSYWDPASGTVTRSVPANSLVGEFRWNPAGDHALLWTMDQGTVLHDVATEEMIPLTGPSNIPRGAAWSPDGTRAAVGAETSQVWVIDFADASFVRLKHPESVVSVAWSPNGSWLAVGLDGGQVWIWDARKGERIEILDGHSNQVQALDFTPDSRFLVSGSWDHSLRVWDTETWRMGERLTGHAAGLTSVESDPSGKFIVTASVDGTVRLWSLLGGRSPETRMTTRGWVWNVAWTPDSTLIAAADREVLAREAGGEPGQLAEASGQINAAGIGRGNSIYAFADASGDLIVKDLISGAVVMEKSMDPRNYFGVAVSTEGDLVAVSSGADLFVWTVPGGEEKYHLDGVNTSIAFSPQGNRLAIARPDRSTVEVVDVGSADQPLSLEGLPGNKGTFGLAWSSDGGSIAAASDDGLVRIWKLDAPSQPRVLQGHAGDAKGVAWSSDDRLIASASLDRTVRIWDAASGQTMVVITGHSSGVRTVAWSLDDKAIASGGEDGMVLLSLANTDDVAALARQQEQVGLTEGERQRCLDAVVDPSDEPAGPRT